MLFSLVGLMLKNQNRGYYRVGLLYTIYRVLLSATLIIVFGFTFYDESDNPYMGVIFPYFTVCLIQAMIFPFLSRKKMQVMACAVMDVLFLSILNWLLGTSNVYSALMFVVTVFVINLVLTRKNALILTLASIISVLYLPYIQGWSVTGYSDHQVLNSLMLTLLFVSVAVIANVLVNRFNRLERINELQQDEIEKFQEISNSVLEQIDTGYIVLNENLEIILINKAAKQVLVINHQPINNLYDINLDLYMQITSRRKLNNRGFSFEFLQNNVSLQTTFRSFHSNHVLYLISLEDTVKISARVHHLKLAALGQLSASIAHEIRNPLATIDQAAKLLKSAVAGDDIAIVDVVLRQCIRIDSIIRSTLNLARRDEFNPIELDVWQAVKNTIDDDLSDIKCKIRLTEMISLIAVFDLGQFRQVIGNLVRNAIRHNDNQVSEVIEIRVYKTDQKICIDVVDFGSGVDASKIEKLFIPFFTTEINGTGLGLYLSKSLCEANNAKIDYVKLNDSSCFRILCQQAESLDWEKVNV